MTTPGEPPTVSGHLLHLDTGARALDALDPDEAAAFDAHLSDCEPCRNELAEFHATAAVLGVASSVGPPAAVRQAVMASIARLPQLPPGPPRSGSTGDIPPGRGAADPLVASPDRRRVAWYRRPASLVAAAALVVLIVVGAVLVATRPADQAADPSAAMEHCVASAPDAHMMMPSVGSGGDVMMAPSCHAAVVRVDGLPALPSGQTYQLWVTSASGPRSAGMLGQYPTPDHAMVTAVDIGDTDIRVSVEPVAGSSAPTSAPVWMVRLDA